MRLADRALAARATWVATRLTGAVSVRLAAPFVGRLWFTPWPVPTPDRVRQRERAWLATADPFEVVLDGRRLVGFTAGRGPTVLLVHGWGERASRLGAFVGPLVERGVRVVAVDLPSHGDSDDGPVAIPDLAVAIAGVARALGGVDAVVAHSIGGPATSIALRDGLDVRAVALLAPAVRLEHAVDTFGRLLRVPPKALLGLRRSIERRFGVGVWEEYAVDGLASTFDVPALIVSDRHDPQVAHEDHELLAEAWPGARLLTTEGLGHTRILHAPDVVEAVVSFVADAITGPPPRGGDVVDLLEAGDVYAS